MAGKGKRVFTAADLKAMSRARLITVIPPGSNRAQVRVSTGKPRPKGSQ